MFRTSSGAVRVLQSLWREEQGIAPGEHYGPHGARPLGSLLPMPQAEQSLDNFLTDTVREVVRAEVCDPVPERWEAIPQTADLQ